MKPGAGPRARWPWFATALLAALLSGAPAAAAADPTFEFAAPAKERETRWSWAAQVALRASGGNSSVFGLSTKVDAARIDAHARMSAGVEAAVARTRIVTATERDGVPGVGPSELEVVHQTAREAWALRARYDRFLAGLGAGYVSCALAGDREAGQRLVASGQLGFGLDVVEGTEHRVRVEVGYDLAYEDRLEAIPLSIHSARLFARYSARSPELVGGELSVEVLTNLNVERDAAAAPFGDTRTRVNGGVDLHLTAWLALGLQGRATHDTSPAPRPPPGDLAFEDGFAPRAEAFDVTAEVVLKASFP